MRGDREMRGPAGAGLREALGKAIADRGYSILLFFEYGSDGVLKPHCAGELAINWRDSVVGRQRLAFVRQEITGLEGCSKASSKKLGEQDRSPADMIAGWERAEGGCREGQKDGLWRFYWNNGTIVQEGSFERGLRSGPWRRMRGGDVMENCTYVEGVREGKCEEMGPTDRIACSGEYRQGRREGLWRCENKKSGGWQILPYVDGTLHGIEIVHPGAGQPETRTEWHWGTPTTIRAQ